ncbi:MAG: hypothetical protein ACTMIY_09845 [Microbacterium gubbeenense]
MITMICDGCGHSTTSELSKFHTWHTGGEVFWETCAGCGHRYEVEIRTKVISS